MSTRPMIASERSVLESEAAKAREYRNERVRPLFLGSVALVVVLTVLWALLAWLFEKIVSVDIGWKSRFAPWILTLELLIVAWIVGSAVVKIVRRPRLRDMETDMCVGTVEELELSFVAGRRFQVLEHGGLMYFFLTDDDRVYVQFDYESQNLGVGGKDPTTSTYLPRAVLIVVRAPKSAFILGSEFSGPPLEVGDTRVLIAKPAKWPESETFCITPWSELESTDAA